MSYVTRSGVRIHYEAIGAGPVVLLHTGGGGDGRMWERAGYTAALTGYRVIAMDHRGRGRSDRPVGPAAHRTREYVADVIAVLDDAGADRAALVGYSGGADIAYATAHRHPSRIGAVVGVGAVGAPDDVDDGVADRVAAIRAEGMRAAMERIAAEEPEQPPEWLLDNLAETSAETYAVYLEATAGDPGNWAHFAAIAAPTLIVCGEDEEPDAARDAVLAARTLPHGTAAVLPGLHHLQAFWRTDLSLPPILGFLHEEWPRR